MAVEQVNGSAGFDPNKISEGSRLRNNSANTNNSERAGDITQKGQDSVQVSELAKFTSLALNEPSPNEGRIAEIQEAVANGSLETDAVLDETAARIADQIL